MSAARADGHAEARALYDSIRFPYWPSWDSLRLRTRDLWAATLRATGSDRDRPAKRRLTGPQDGELPFTPNSDTPAVAPAPVGRVERPAEHSAPNRYAAGAEPLPDPAAVLLGEAGFAPG